ncbi:hypothetical protein BO85DRAFT_201744 [Aspergillus piperis CBS 112811]|uniref:Uncharacterized protein n=1 Tax=Aspergillus piperis CBS 112811 TaxID=1448313 RepID=A0A8G1QW46_9EURO|nr:hypothetical protein BO85DRAFT_201744 [Aspergillus piperis CBS 112811]RAH52480.1 hypothetical protein BO85DRAFT_201744 [Aspergillus piperis CBS 112811]
MPLYQLHDSVVSWDRAGCWSRALTRRGTTAAIAATRRSGARESRLRPRPPDRFGAGGRLWSRCQGRRGWVGM